MPNNTLTQQQQAISSKYLLPSDPSNPMADTFNYDAFRQSYSQAAQQTSQVIDPGLPKAPNVGQYSPTGQALQQAYKQYGAEKQGMQQQADKAAEALRLQGANTEQYMKGLQTTKEETHKRADSAMAGSDAAADAAAQYVKEANARKDFALRSLSDLANDMGTSRDFAKAHNMQTAAQSVIGSFKERERDVALNYGRDSAEFQQLQAEKSKALATAQSTIHSTWQQLKEEMDKTVMAATADTLTKSDMYINFQEQLHVETLKALDQTNKQFALQLGAFDLQIEQLRMQGLTEAADWLTNSPSFVMDTQGIMSLLMTYQEEQNQKHNTMLEDRIGMMHGSPWSQNELYKQMR